MVTNPRLLIPADHTLTTANTSGWMDRHNQAVRRPFPELELAIVANFDALETLAVEFERTHECKIGEDAYGAPIFASMCRNLINLMNFSIGRLDAATVDAAIRRLAIDNLVEEEI